MISTTSKGKTAFRLSVLGIVLTAIGIVFFIVATIYSAIEYNVLEDQGAIDFPVSPVVNILMIVGGVLLLASVVVFLLAIVHHFRTRRPDLRA